MNIEKHTTDDLFIIDWEELKMGLKTKQPYMQTLIDASLIELDKFRIMFMVTDHWSAKKAEHGFE